MAVVGEAHVIVRAITTAVPKDIERGFNGINQTAASRAGKAMGNSFFSGFRASGANSVFGKVADGLRTMVPDAEASRLAFRKLAKTGYVLSTGLGVAAGGIGALGSGLVSLVAGLAAAAQGVPVLIGALGALRVAAFIASFSLKGVSQAVAAATNQTSAYADANEDAAKKLKDLKFQAEEASLSQERAALNLEKAREAVQRVQDLPPNSRARREAELALKEAEFAYRRAKDNAEDLQDTVEKGVKPTKAGSDPYAGLTESQKAFAQFLVSIQPKIAELREAVAKEFLPGIEKQINRILEEVFPMLITKLPLVAGAVATAAELLTDRIVDSENVDQLGRILEGLVPIITDWGTIFGNVYDIALDIAEALLPVVKLFTGDLITATDNWKKKIETMNNDGSLTAMFERGYGVLGIFAGIVGNTLSGLGNLVSLNFGEGGGGYVILKWLDDVSGKFANLGKESPEAKLELEKFFTDSANNATSVLDAIGAFLGEIFKLADNPAIKTTFDTLAKGAPAFGDLLESGLEAGPSFAELIVTLIELGNALTDTGALEIFFTTINDLAKIATDFFKSELGQSVFEISGRIFAFGLALGSVLGPIKFFAEAVTGNLVFITQNIDKFITGMGAVQTFFLKFVVLGSKVGGFLGGLLGIFGKVGMFLTGPWGIAIAAVVAGLVFFFTQTETGKAIFQGFMDFMAGVVDWLVEAWNNAAKFLGEAFSGIGEFMSTITSTIAGVWETAIGVLMEIFTGIADFFIGVWTAVIGFLQPIIDIYVAIFTTAFNIIRAVIEVIVAIIIIIFVGIGNRLQAIWDAIVAGFNAARDFLIPIFEAIGEFAAEVWQGILDAFDAMWDFLRPIVQAIGRFFGDVFRNIGNFASTLWTNIRDGFQRFVDWIRGPLEKIGDFFESVFNGIGRFLRGAINTYLGFVEGFVNFFIRGLNGIIDGINKIKLEIPPFLRNLFGGQTSIGFNIARVPDLKIPRLAKGGTVFPSSGGSIVNVAEAGRPERIEPLDPSGLSARDRALVREMSSGGTGVIINVHPSVGMNERELAQLVSRELAFKMRRGGV